MDAQMQQQSHRARGTLCALVGGALWGFSGSCAQFLLQNYPISPLMITFIRMAGAGVLFMIVLLARHREKLAAMFSDRSTAIGLVVFGVAGLYLCQITYTIVVGYTNAGTATVLQCLGIVIIMVFTCIVGRRMPRAFELVGLVLSLAATWLIATHGDAATIVLPLPGLLWGLANAVTVAFYISYPKNLFARWGSFAVTGCAMFIGGIAAAFVALPQVSLPPLDAAGYGALGAIIVLGTFAAFSLYLQGVADVGAVRGSMLGVAEPVSAQFISWLWLGTAFSAADWLGFAMMVAMVFLVTLAEGEPDRAAAPQER